MTELLYLGIAVVLSIVGSAILWLRHHKPSSLESGIDDFSRELRALAPDPSARRRGPRRGGRTAG